jgi:endonuclease YncB( thermonuclease family)
MRNQFTFQIAWSEKFKLCRIRDGRRDTLRAIGDMKNTGPGPTEPVALPMRQILALALGLLVLTPCAVAADSVVDGDTLYVGRLKYRLCGIDAPERGQLGSQAAADHLRYITKGKAIACRPVGEGTPCDGRSSRKSHGRIVAQCFVDGQDIAAEMVRSGHARDWPKFSGGYYAR